MFTVLFFKMIFSFSGVFHLTIRANVFMLSPFTLLILIFGILLQQYFVNSIVSFARYSSISILKQFCHEVVPSPKYVKMTHFLCFLSGCSSSLFFSLHIICHLIYFCFKLFLTVLGFVSFSGFSS